MVTNKQRKESGRTEPRLAIEHIDKDYIIENCMEPQIFWDDWTDHRDGMRFAFEDLTLYTPENAFGFSKEHEKANEKIKKHEKIREARKSRWEQGNKEL